MFLPGMFNRPPAVYGPIKYPVKKTKDGYYIQGYSVDEFTGSPRDIAKKIILKFINEPETGSRKNYVGPFWLQFKPEVRCNFVMDAEPDPPDLDLKALSDAITEELRTLKNLIPFG